MRKLVIIGSGPAGLTAAIYAARAALDLAVHALLEPVVDFPDDLQGVGVLALSILLPVLLDQLAQ